MKLPTVKGRGVAVGAAGGGDGGGGGGERSLNPVLPSPLGHCSQLSHAGHSLF